MAGFFWDKNGKKVSDEEMRKRRMGFNMATNSPQDAYGGMSRIAKALMYRNRDQMPRMGGPKRGGGM